MKQIKIIKLVLGVVLIFISLIGSIPFISTGLLEGIVINSYYQSEHRYSQNSKSHKNILDTNYPIYLGMLGLAGAVILVSLRDSHNE